MILSYLLLRLLRRILGIQSPCEEFSRHVDQWWAGFMKGLQESGAFQQPGVEKLDGGSGSTGEAMWDIAMIERLLQEREARGEVWDE